MEVPACLGDGGTSYRLLGLLFAVAVFAKLGDRGLSWRSGLFVREYDGLRVLDGEARLASGEDAARWGGRWARRPGDSGREGGEEGASARDAVVGLNAGERSS